DELRVHLGVLDLEDVELDLLAGQLLEVAADAVGLGAAATDDDPRAGGVDVDTDAVTRALDVDLGDARALHALAHHAPDRHVFLDVVAVALARASAVGEPTAAVLGRDAEAEPVRVDLLPHGGSPLLSGRRGSRDARRHDDGDVAGALADAVGPAL